MKLTDALKKQLQEARQEAQAGWDAFQSYKKEHTEDDLLNKKDLFDEAHRLHGVYGEAADKAAEIEARLMKSIDMDGDGPEGEGKPSFKDLGENKPETKAITRSMLGLGEKLADAVIESEEYKAFLKSDAAQSEAVSIGSLFSKSGVLDRAEVKTLLTGANLGQGVFLLPDLQPGYVMGFDRVAMVMTDLITMGQTDNDKVEWVSYDSLTNAAAETAEAVDADKAAGAAASSAPESAMSFSLKSTSVQEIKHFIPATKRILADIGQFRTIIDQELTYGLNLRIDNQILNGSGTGVNLLGILNASGIQTQARGTDPQIEAIHKAMTKLLISNYPDHTVLLHPNDWQNIRLAKDVMGDYYLGPPGITGTMQLWGRPVATSVNLAAGTGIVSDFKRACTMWLRSGLTIAATDSHSDWFVKGIIAILCSMRAAFGTVRPRAVCTVTGL